MMEAEERSGRIIHNITVVQLFLSGKQIIIGVAAFLLGFCPVFISRYERIHNPRAISFEKTQVIRIPRETGLGGLDRILRREGVKYSRKQFHWVARMLGWSHFQPGQYDFGRYQGYAPFLRRLALGIQTPVRVTILPGQTEEGFAHQVSSRFRFSGSQLWQAMHDTTLLSKMGVSPVDLIGRMLPDTYQFYWTATPQQFISRILHVFDQKVVQPYQERYKQLDKSVDQIITLASIVEWEAGSEEEKPIIAGLYWNRLKRGWKLQADPTIDYAIGKRRRLLFDDYRTKSPYNTYLHRGLPPGPITNPSLNSIQAVLYPNNNDYMFMVATPQGVHVFSKTFAEHRRQSAEWRKWLRKQYRIKRKREQIRLDSLRGITTK